MATLNLPMMMMTTTTWSTYIDFREVGRLYKNWK